MNGRERILATLNHQPADCLAFMPITMMFAADQIGAAYGKYAADHRVMVEAQIRTAEKFDFDYVSGISDPAREAADCGAVIHMFDNQPPAIDETNSLLLDKKTLATLKVPDPLGGGRMHDRVQAMALFTEKTAGQKLIEGWIEGPCAQSADLRGINRLMTDFFDDPDFVRDLFEFVLEMELRFAKAQVEAGADIIGMGDAAASLVGPKIYRDFVMPYEKKMIDALHAMGTRVRLHICGNIRRSLKDIGTVGADMIDIDWMVPLHECRAAMGPEAVLAGNLDPVKALRNSTPEAVLAAVAQCHREAGQAFIVGAGCEVPRDTAEANVHAMREYARNAGVRG
jgi:MtaA/CmuA family methyltransferase